MSVEFGRLVDGNIALRDGKDQGGPVLVYSPAEWDAFVEGVKAGEFDLSALAAHIAKTPSGGPLAPGEAPPVHG
ncbi:DUF397 domain-containing protein [Nonomuraea typhae]|uniref:DUF397 domain-containing protein n=1 Tax=Nonomuraea typhae TaxID=2603600 RepID=A0ABW7YM06_9ACTN